MKHAAILRICKKKLNICTNTIALYYTPNFVHFTITISLNRDKIVTDSVYSHSLIILMQLNVLGGLVLLLSSRHACNL